MKTSVTVLSSYFAPYHVILEEKKNTVQETFNQFLIKKRIEQQQPESAVDIDDLLLSLSMM